MREHGYPELVAHSYVHKSFINKVAEFQAQHKAGKQLVTVEILDFLKQWLVEHIMGIDKRYAAFFNAKGVH